MQPRLNPPPPISQTRSRTIYDFNQQYELHAEFRTTRNARNALDTVLGSLHFA